MQKPEYTGKHSEKRKKKQLSTETKLRVNTKIQAR